MTISSYNNASQLYQILNNNFYDFHAKFSEFHMCFPRDSEIFVNEVLNLIRSVESIKLQDLLTQEGVIKFHFSQDYLTSALAKVNENTICVHLELGRILIFYPFHKFKNSINQFIIQLNKLSLDQTLGVFSKDGCILMGFARYESLKPNFEQITDFKYIHHFFAQSNSQLIYLNGSSQVVIETDKMKKVIKDLEFFELDKLVLD